MGKSTKGLWSPTLALIVLASLFLGSFSIGLNNGISLYGGATWFFVGGRWRPGGSVYRFSVGVEDRRRPPYRRAKSKEALFCRGFFNVRGVRYSDCGKRIRRFACGKGCSGRRVLCRYDGSCGDDCRGRPCEVSCKRYGLSRARCRPCNSSRPLARSGFRRIGRGSCSVRRIRSDDCIVDGSGCAEQKLRCAPGGFR